MDREFLGDRCVGKEYNDTVILYHTNDKTSLSHNNIFSFLEDSKGRIWVATREGLNLFNEQTKTFQVFTTAAGLPHNMILDMLEDDHGTFWLSTPNGLYNAIPRQKENGLSFSLIGYDEMKNLQNREFNENAAFKTKAGELIFGGPSGFNIIDPDKIQKPFYHPVIVFTGLQILNNNIEPGELINDRVLLKQSITQLQNIDLIYKENVFSIEFASPGISYGSPDKYAYMMQSFNSDWLYTDGDHRRATYTNLDPGQYTFKVKVQNGDGSWSEVKNLQVNIHP